MAWIEVPPPPDDHNEEGLQFSGTTGRSAKNNNPLNLEYRPGSYQEKYGAVLEPRGGGKDKKPRFAAFPDMMSGYLAGIEQIRLDQNKGLTLEQFVHKFAPSFENPTEQLISQYANAVGARRDTPLANIPPEKLIVPMLARESSTKIVGRGANKGILESIGSYLGPSSAEAAEVPPPPSGFREVAPPPPGFKEVAPPTSEAPVARSTGQKLAGVVASYLGLKLPIVGMTPTQIGALALGGTAGAAAGGPAGAVAGAGLAYGAEEQAMKGLRQYAGQEPTETLTESAKGAAKDVATGATYEAAGQVGGTLMQPIAEKFGQFLMNRAKGLYERVLKVPTTVDPKLRDAAIETAIKGDAAITKGGLKKVYEVVDNNMRRVDNIIDEVAGMGDTMERNKIYQGLARLKSYFSDAPFQQANMDAVTRAQEEILSKYPERIPVDEAQRMKQRLYQIFEKAYQNRVTVDVVDKEIGKVTAREIMADIERNVPEVAALNKETSAYLNLKEFLERAVNRVRNYETFRMGDMIMTVGGLAEGGVEGGAKAYILQRIINNPSFLSHMALIMGKNRPWVKEVLNKTISYGLTTQAKEDIEAAQPPEKIEPESKRGFTILNQ